jgi:hypothetical protein
MPALQHATARMELHWSLGRDLSTMQGNGKVRRQAVYEVQQAGTWDGWWLEFWVIFLLPMQTRITAAVLRRV